MSLEALKSNVLDLCDDAVVVGYLAEGDAKAQVVYANAAFSRLSGYQTDRLIGADMHALFANGQCLNDLVAGTMALGSVGPPVCDDICVVGPDGSKFELSVTLNVADAAQGQGRYVYAICRPCKPTNDGLEKSETDREDVVLMQDRLSAAIDAFPEPFVIYDKDLKLMSWNSAYADSMSNDRSALTKGMSLRDVLARAVADGRYPAAIGRADEWIDEILSMDTLSKSTDDVELDNDIHQRLYRYRLSNGDYVVIRLNSTEPVRQRREAENAQARLLAALNAYPSPFVIYDSNDCIVVWNDAYSAFMATDAEPIEVGMNRTQVAQIALRAGKLFKSVEKDVEKPIQDLELPGDVHQRLLRSRVENGDLVIVRIDTTELVQQRRAVEQYAHQLEKANQDITRMAFHDDLTGLGNRRLLKQKFDEFEARRSIDGGEIAALHIDLDRFKQINDSMGHSAGDQVLLDVAERILKRAGADDVVTRIGGDEFVVLIYACDGGRQPEDLAQHLLSDLARPTLFQGKECRLGASIGMAITPLTSVDQLLTNSDIALYKAKAAGRGRLAIFDQNDLEELRRHKTLADDVLGAIERREFVPFFQPQVDAVTQEVVGIEVLARWDKPGTGILAPVAFLSMATDLDVVADIDKIVFERAIELCSRAFFGLENVPTLSFNVSASRVNNYDVSEVKKHILTYPGKVSFELLETIFMEEEETEFFWKLDQFRDLGIGIEVDDFGSGRASVVALQRINPDRVKIDRRLVAPIDKSGAALHLLRSIVEIGHALKMGVTAEGVETSHQADLLAELGCDRLQGYYFAKPLSFDDLIAFMTKGMPILRKQGIG